MRGPVPRIFSASPKPLVLRQHNPYSKCCFELENVSISSTDTEGEPAESLFGRLSNEVKWFLYDIAEAFEAQYEQPKPTTTENQRLSAIALRRDLKRCYSFLHPLVEVGAALYDTLLWKNPINTLLLALVYSYSIVRGWTASLVLLLLWTQLSLNYLKATKNIDIGLYFLPRKEVAMPKFDITGAQLIFDVAKFAQKLLNFSANLLEKWHSLLTWRDVNVTLVFYCLVIYWLALSMIFNTGTCLGMCGLTIGVRIFITTYLFHRFPRLRKRLDTYGWFYRNLPVKTMREGSPTLIATIDGLPATASKTNSPMPRRSLNVNGLFTSRLGSNFNLDTTGSQHSLLSQKRGSAFSLYNLVPRGSLSNIQANLKARFILILDHIYSTKRVLNGSTDCLSERASPTVSQPRTQWLNNNGNVESFDCNAIPSNTRASRPGISPLAVKATSPSPPQDPPPCETTSLGTEEDELTESSSSLSTYTSGDEESVHEDLIGNVLAYRSCVMNDKERSFPKGISSGILYLTESALIYRTKSTHDDRTPTVMLFADIISIQSLRTMGLLAGTRKSLEIILEGKKKPLQFIGLAQRDDFFGRIESVCERMDARIHFL
ncbi:hypothetical protein NECAME_09215 [Necator americanus]|uniref:GRAM domain-containing protein n=1 Tax=Necator americanus TaxID=51031 RepID=W2TFK9_NECAM|nr:hypothetical protein NECAME_09215 [Necator americanus]ETN80374.1 hypothetical protein NECAME_09215 [Necator americanus]